MEPILDNPTKWKSPRNQNKHILIVASILLSVFQTLTHGSIIPTEGTFQGIYHRYRSGGGRFSSTYLVPESLQSKFDKYDGKLIEVTVTKGIQPINPGPAIILEIGDIKEFPAAPVEISLEILPNQIPSDGAFQILAKVKNISDTTVTIRPESFIISALQVPEDKSEQTNFWDSQYHVGTFMTKLQRNQLRSVIYSIPLHRQYILGDPSDLVVRVSLEPGDSFPFVMVFDNGLDKGQYEAEATLQFYINNGADSITVGSWLDFDIGAGNTVVQKAKSDLELKMSDIEIADQWSYLLKDKSKTEYKWYLANLTLMNNGKSKKMLPQVTLDTNEILWLGRIYGWSSDGKQIPLTFDHPKYNSGPPTNPWRIEEIDSGETYKSEIRFRPVSYFPDNPIARITCELLTERGLETFVLTDTFDDSLFLKPPLYGSEKNGVKCRIRTDSLNYKRGDGILLFWQIVNTKEKTLTFTGNDKWSVKIDGKNVENMSGQSGVWGWASKYGLFEPKESYFKIDSSDLSVGEHSVQIFLEGKGGTYKNTNNDDIPVFKGTLKSNSWSFKIIE